MALVEFGAPGVSPTKVSSSLLAFEAGFGTLCRIRFQVRFLRSPVRLFRTPGSARGAGEAGGPSSIGNE